MHRKALWLLAILGLMMQLPPAAAHKYFFGLTEISYNSRSNSVEVVHQYTLHDIQRAMTKQFGRDFRIDQPAAEQKLRKWVAKHFQLFDSSDQNVRLNWVGFEADFQNIWFYQELAQEKPDFCAWKVRNSLLMESFPAQVNTVNFLTDEKTHGVTLTNDSRYQGVKCLSD